MNKINWGKLLLAIGVCEGAGVVGCQFNVSLKLDNSGNTEKIRLRPRALRTYNELSQATFKFVVQFYDDIVEIGAITITVVYDPNLNKITVVSEGKTKQIFRSMHWMLLTQSKEVAGDYSLDLR